MSDSNKPISSKSFARRRTMKKIGIYGASITSALIVIMILFSLIPRGNGAFTIMIDDLGETSSHFTMKNGFGEGATSAAYLTADPISKAIPTEAKEVEKYLSSFDSLEEISGNKNFSTEFEGEKREHALVYTVALDNQSETEDQIFKYSVQLNAYQKPSNNANGPLDYLRIVIQTSVVDDSNTPLSNQRETVFYGSNRDSTDVRGVSVDSPYGDYAEPISDRSTVAEYIDGTNINMQQSNYESESGQKFCVGFLETENDGDNLVVGDLLIPKGKSLRFTFASYFEAKDYDCSGNRPVDSYILLSLHFGL